MKSLILAFAVMAGPAVADVMVYKDDNVLVQLADTACAKASLIAVLKGADLDGAKAALVLFEGKNILACWALIPGGVVLVDEAGGGGIFPITSFKRSPGI